MRAIASALLLAAGQPVAALADDGVVAVGQRGDHVVDLRGAARRVDLVVGRVGPCVAQVGEHRVVEQMRVLRDDADGGAQRCLRQVAHVVAVDAHRAVGDVVEARDQRC